MNDNKGRSGGIGFTGVLTVVFVVLKLLGKITWKWIWVIPPIWISLLLVIVLAVISAMIDNF